MEIESAIVEDWVLNRKGARKASDIPAEVAELLLAGRIESVNLTEWLAVDHAILLQHTLPALGLGEAVSTVQSELERAKGQGIMKLLPLIGKKLFELLADLEEDRRGTLFHALSSHRSDSVRCWAAYVVGVNDSLSIEEKLAQIKPFAADPHFGVREIAWMAVRGSITQSLEGSIHLFQAWVVDSDENIRRFAIESTRPRGVWSKHIDELKQNPARALQLLDRVKADRSKYVQDSVGNWLNDASKSNPGWVLQVCQEWLEATDSKATKRIVTKAKRTIEKKRAAN
ncbi:DNA alkylation repair protein [Tumebacillus lipolyticus]|uniref:DNA alkylation repair protein n=1 Tax=Tumebacillus lipolyticus TaxID=1280370 RepID=A0ABW4ZWH9_9BACL